MTLLVIGLTLVGSLFIGAAIQAQERIGVVSIECDGRCDDSTLGQLCRDLVGPTFRPFAVDCQNVQEGFQEQTGDIVACGGNNRCLVKDVKPTDPLSAYCDDGSVWDANVYCEETRPRLVVENGICSDSEVPVMPDGFVQIAPSLFYSIPREDHICNVTFTFEAATSESTPQLLALAYLIRIEGEPSPPADCAFQPGPVLTEVRSGFDETHTFTSRINLTGSTTPGLLRRILPCASSELEGQFRLRRRCLLIQCYAQ